MATCYAEATRAMKSRQFDLAFLDFDLADRRHNGADVAAFMARLPRARRPRCLVHSQNFRGAYAIHVTLKNAGYDVETDPFPPRC